MDGIPDGDYDLTLRAAANRTRDRATARQAARDGARRGRDGPATRARAARHGRGPRRLRASGRDGRRARPDAKACARPATYGRGLRRARRAGDRRVRRPSSSTSPERGPTRRGPPRRVHAPQHQHGATAWLRLTDDNLFASSITQARAPSAAASAASSQTAAATPRRLTRADIARNGISVGRGRADRGRVGQRRAGAATLRGGLAGRRRGAIAGTWRVHLVPPSLSAPTPCCATRKRSRARRLFRPSATSPPAATPHGARRPTESELRRCEQQRRVAWDTAALAERAARPRPRKTSTPPPSSAPKILRCASHAPPRTDPARQRDATPTTRKRASKHTRFKLRAFAPSRGIKRARRWLRR